ncbi:MAG: type III-B CRISPR-associated protein Cas10/Cmr2 [Ardenticatenia bacterium]|nr:MAG: type III-B CRISPR-associated protein Cas10/Cmr2 [Ardenticatenia bacterium]
MSTKYLFICSIGPVQDFIAAARSSRDLTYGSHLLSELAKTAARTIADREGFNALIFPAPKDEAALKKGSNLSVANKVVAVVSGEPKGLADAIEEALRAFILNAWQPIEDELKNDVDKALARWQLKDLLEFYWVAAPLEEKYEEVRATCEAALSARKATRDFRRYTGKPRFKSSIDGWREHVLEQLPNTASSPTDKQMKRYKMRNGELLSGVDLLKRWGGLQLGATYKSTGHMAALPFAQGLGVQTADTLREELENLFTQNGGTLFAKEDYSVFFPSEVRAVFKDKEIVKQILEGQERLMSQYAGKHRPSPYYALLLADGDSMGKAIDAQTSPEAHRALSQKLSEFAQKVPKIVEKHRGVPVYAGGDDILAYLPLHTALECVRELAETFQETMNAFTFDENGQQKSPTLSAGLVITHHLEPLRDALALVRAAEKSAKTVAGKNALAITLNKRSGADRTVKDNLFALIERLETMRGWWLNETLSKGTAYELERLARDMGGVLPAGALAAEAVRILERKRQSGGTQKINPQIIQTLKGWLAHIPLHELAQEMIVANELA